MWEAHEATKRAEAAILAHEREAATVLVAEAILAYDAELTTALERD